MRQATDDREYLLRVCMCEIYNEVVRDLLVDSDEPLGVRGGPGGTTVVSGLSEHTVATAEEVFKHLERGNESRMVSR